MTKPAKNTKTQVLFNTIKENKDRGVARIDSLMVAKLIRARLKQEFPGVKFSVRKDGYDCVWVNWENGPARQKVSKVVEEYSFGGFDGMNDSSYSWSNWLTPDGKMTRAKCYGSGAMVSPFDYPAPSNDAILICGGPSYISCSQEISREAWERKIEELPTVPGYEGFVPNLNDYWNVQIDGQYVSRIIKTLVDEGKMQW